MHVIVTGAGGFVGCHLVQSLLADGHEVTASDLTVDGLADGARKIVGDLCDPEIRRALLSQGCDALVHMATVPGGAAEADPAASHRVNVGAMSDLLDDLSAAGNVPRVVYASSIAVLGDAMPPEGVDDATPLSPMMIYGGHKAMMEPLVATLSNRGLIDGVTIRLPGILARPMGAKGIKSAFLSEVFHVLRAGKAFTCPVSPGATIWAQSLTRCVANFRHALSLDHGEPIDWVLVMNRFAPNALLEDVAERGELDHAMVLHLADNIARFHSGAERAESADGAARIRQVIDGNRRAMAALPAATLSSDLAGQVYAAGLAETARIAPLLNQRASEGRVRHCHGDLHLGNICLWEGQPLLFDCLEFDEELATTDTLYDLAFLLMDLCERGFGEQANLLFNRYCDMIGEAEGLAALPLFLSTRAAIRAHVSASAAARQPDPQASAAKLNQAQTYLIAALSFLDPQPPRMMAIGGLSGTGKSTLAGALAPDIGRPPGARWLRTDVLRKRLAGVAPEAKLPASSYIVEQSRTVYEELARQAQAVLAGGQSVVVDAVFAAPSERAAIAGIALEAGVPFTGIWLEAPSEVLRRRVDGRTGDASDADSAVVNHQLEYEIGDLGLWRRVDASGTPGEVAARAKPVIG